MKTFQIGVGDSRFDEADIIKGKLLPNLITLMYVRTKKFRGNYTNAFESRRYYVKPDELSSFPIQDVVDDDTPLSMYNWNKHKLFFETLGRKTKAERKALLKNLKSNTTVEKTFINRVELKLNGKFFF